MCSFGERLMTRNVGDQEQASVVIVCEKISTMGCPKHLLLIFYFSLASTPMV